MADIYFQEEYKPTSFPPSNIRYDFIFQVGGVLIALETKGDEAEEKVQNIENKIKHGYLYHCDFLVIIVSKNAGTLRHWMIKDQRIKTINLQDLLSTIKELKQNGR